MQQFIEVTNQDGIPMIIGLRHIKRIEKDRKDGLAVLYPDNDGMRIYCKESYEQVRSALLGGQKL